MFMQNPRIRRWYLKVLFAVVVFLGAVGLPPRCQEQPVTQLDRDALLGHLGAVIIWYRDVTTKVQPTGLPSDAIYQDNAQTLGAQVVRLAFQSAHAEADLVPASAKAAPAKPGANKTGSGSASDAKPNAAKPSPDGNLAPSPNASANPTSGANQPGSAPPRRQNLAQTLARIAAQIDDVQEKLDGVNKSLATAAGPKRRDLIAQRDRLQGQLALNKAMLDAIQKMSAFVEGSADDSDDLDTAIDQLARSVPEVLGAAGRQENGWETCIAACASQFVRTRRAVADIAGPNSQHARGRSDRRRNKQLARHRKPTQETAAGPPVGHNSARPRSCRTI
jgi:hypothetical protein